MMFSGDLLFAGSIGRTDLPGGDHADDAAQPRRQGAAAGRRHRRAARPRRADLDRARARHQPLPPRPGTDVTWTDEQDQPAERVPRAAARAARRRARGHRVAVAHLRAARLRQHRDPRRRADRPAGQGRRGRQGDLRPPADRRRARRRRPSSACTSTSPCPFARYVLEHAGHLEFPFRRFQVQPAWRGERPQEGRYRQFTQADVDIVGRDELPFHHDVEVMSVMVDALSRLPIPRLSVPVQQPQADPGLLPRPGHRRRHRRDPRHRQARQAPGRRGRRACWSSGSARRRSRRSAASSWPRSGSPTPPFVEQVRALGVTDELLDQGLEELAAVVEGCRAVAGDRVDVEANLRIARGLDYYTGTVVEIFMAGYERLKSVGGEGATTRSPATAVRPIPASACPSASPARSSRSSPTASCPAAGPCRAPSSSPSTPRTTAPPARQVAAALRAPRHRVRGRADAREVRQADPLRRAPRHPLRLVRPGRRDAPGQGHPLRRAGRGRPRHLDPAGGRPPAHHRQHRT